MLRVTYDTFDLSGTNNDLQIAGRSREKKRMKGCKIENGEESKRITIVRMAERKTKEIYLAKKNKFIRIPNMRPGNPPGRSTPSLHLRIDFGSLRRVRPPFHRRPAVHHVTKQEPCY